MTPYFLRNKDRCNGYFTGTAVAANMSAHMAELCRDQGRTLLPTPDAVVLEAPFNNLMDEIESHPFSKVPI